MNIRAKKSATIFVLLLVFARSESFAGGFAIPEQSTISLGLANAITAGVEDASASYVNPAALPEIDGNQLMGNLSYINTLARVRNTGSKSRDIHDADVLPNLFANYHLPGTDITLGIGTYTPFGLATSYSENSFTRFAAIRTQLKTIYLTPAVGWRPSPDFSIGAGVSFVHSSALLSRAIFLGAAGVGEGRLRVTATDNAYGYNFGILVKPHERIKFGLTYRSRVRLKFDDAEVEFSDAPFTGGASTKVKGRGINLPIPSVINTGVQWQITPMWAVELDYNFTHWSEFKHLKANFSSPLPALGGTAPIAGFLLPQDWKNTSTIRLATKYRINNNFEARAGMSLDQTPIPSRTLSPSIPGADFLALNAGLGYSWNKLNIDAGYMAVFYKTRKVLNNSLETGNSANALPFSGLPGRDSYEIFQNFVSLSVRYRF